MEWVVGGCWLRGGGGGSLLVCLWGGWDKTGGGGDLFALGVAGLGGLGGTDKMDGWMDERMDGWTDGGHSLTGP